VDNPLSNSCSLCKEELTIKRGGFSSCIPVLTDETRLNLLCSDCCDILITEGSRERDEESREGLRPTTSSLWLETGLFETLSCSSSLCKGELIIERRGLSCCLSGVTDETEVKSLCSDCCDTLITEGSRERDEESRE